MIVCTHTAATSGRADGGATGAVAAFGSLQEEINSGHEEKTRGRSSDWWSVSSLLAKKYLVLEILQCCSRFTTRGQQDEMMDDGAERSVSRRINCTALLLQMRGMVGILGGA